MKILKPGLYYVHVLNKKLICKNGEDLSEFVEDFSLFENLLIDLDGDVLRLVFNNGDPLFVKFPILTECGFMDFKTLRASDVMKKQTFLV